MAATAAKRVGLAPTVVPLDSTSFHVEGRSNRDKDPAAQVIQLTRGDSRDQRPDLHHVRLDLLVEHQAGLPVWMNPLRGHSRDAPDFGQVVSTHVAPLQTTDGTTSLVAESALSSADNLQQLAHTRLTWMTRVPATVREAQEA
jgi:transposase